MYVTLTANCITEKPSRLLQYIFDQAVTVQAKVHPTMKNFSLLMKVSRFFVVVVFLPDRPSPHYWHYIEKPTQKSTFSPVFHRRDKVIQVWNDTKVVKLWKIKSRPHWFHHLHWWREDSSLEEGTRCLCHTHDSELWWKLGLSSYSQLAGFGLCTKWEQIILLVTKVTNDKT